MKKASVFFLCSMVILISFASKGQTNFNKVWVNGGGFTYTTSFIGTQTFNAKIDSFHFKYFANGNSNICDSDGKLVLISDGMNIYDSSAFNIIENGDTLVNGNYFIHQDGWSGYSQSSIFLPFLNGIYYLITPDVTDSMFDWWYTPPFPHSAPFDRLLYHKIDMQANGGAGKVIEKAVPLLEHAKLSKSQMMACKHANGKDWWLIKQWSEENKIVKFLIKEDSILGPYYQSFSGAFSLYDQSGQSMFSLDGTKYATTCRGTNKVFMADFDRCTGIFSNPKWIDVPNYSRHEPSDTSLQDLWTQGLAFSPNGNFLYVLKYWNILQLDLNDLDSSTAWYHVAGLDTAWLNFTLYDNSYLGKDNKLYIGYFGMIAKELSILNSPDSKGGGCNFCPKCLVFPSGWGNTSTPPCMPNYDLGTLSPCRPLQNVHVKENEKEWSVYPNPANTKLYISSSKLKSNKQLYNSIGQLVFTTTANEIDVSTLPKGLYYLRCEGESKKVVVE